MNAPIVVLVAKRTSWQKYVEETRDPHVIELLRQHDPTVSLMKAAHEAHEATLREVEAAILRLGIEPRHVEDPHRPFATQGARLVMTVGGDGTLLSASHQVQGVPILGVNSAPGFSVGFFCGATPGTVDETLARFLDGGLPSVTLTLGGRVEEQRSSGFWVGPAAGSTAAQRSAGGQVLPLDSEDLQVVVREPYTPQGRPLELIRELIPPGNSLIVRSKLYDGKLFMDGPNESEPVTLGDVLEFRKSAEPLELLCLSPDRHRC
jgi:NAD+ kinase